MINYFKTIINKQSIIQSTLIKVTLTIFFFLITFMLLYGMNFWEKMAIKQNFELIVTSYKMQSTIESNIKYIEDLKSNIELSKAQKILGIKNLIEPIINSNKAYTLGYYDISLDTSIYNKLDNLDFKYDFNKFSYNNKLQTLSITPLTNNNVIINIPIFQQGKIVGYVWSYSNKSDFLANSYYDMSGLLISTLSLSLLIIIIIRRHFNIIKLYLDRFSKLIINNEYKQDDLLSRLPELKPVLNRITYFTDNLKQVNKELESSKLKVTKIIEGISDGFFALDRNWQFTFVNQETERIFNKDNTDLLGKSIWDVFPQSVNTITFNRLMEAISKNETVYWEDKGVISPSQSFEYHAYPFEEGLTVYLRDITEIKRQQQELGRLERLNLIGQLAAGISHEIRNPLTTVKGFLQILGSKSKYMADKDYFELMISEIDRANNIISDFLSLSKVNLDDIKPNNLNATIDKLFPMIQADAFSNNKEVVLDLNELPEIMINENEIRQLILNLVRNGLEVTPEHECVIISTYTKEDNVILTVKDHGTGIPKEIQDKIGTPFFTTKETGTGLGLAISMGIAQRHEAIFEFETGVNGTIFRVIFPTLQGNKVSCAC